MNNIMAKRSADGTINIQFGGCDGNIPNCLPITKGWNYTVRRFRPRPEILDGTWKFPEARPAVYPRPFAVLVARAALGQTQTSGRV